MAGRHVWPTRTLMTESKSDSEFNSEWEEGLGLLESFLFHLVSFSHIYTRVTQQKFIFKYQGTLQ